MSCLAVWAGHLLERSVPQAAGIFAVQVDLSLDWRALVFAAGICVVTTVLCGLVPAWRVSRMSRMMVVQGSVGETTRRKPVGLVVQVVMSLVLLFIGASFLGALVRLHGTYPGFAVAGRLLRTRFSLRRLSHRTRVERCMHARSTGYGPFRVCASPPSPRRCR